MHSRVNLVLCQRSILCYALTIIFLISNIESVLASPSPLVARTAPLQNSTKILAGPLSATLSQSAASSSSTYFPITATPTFIYDGDPLSCYPHDILQTTPRWWGNQTVPNNICTHKLANGCNNWSPCSLTAQEIKLVYWPTSINESYPSTSYDSFHEYTFTYPSIYMIFHTMHAWNACKKNTASGVGPTMTSAIHGFDPSQVSTLMPYTDDKETGPMTPGQLNVTDLFSNCPTTLLSTHSLYTYTHPVGDGPSYRCFPRLAIPTMVNDFGAPWWDNCVVVNTDLGMVDPPSPLTYNGPLTPFSTTVPPVTASPDPILTLTKPLISITETSQHTKAPVPLSTSSPITDVSKPGIPPDPPSTSTLPAPDPGQQSIQPNLSKSKISDSQIVGNTEVVTGSLPGQWQPLPTITVVTIGTSIISSVLENTAAVSVDPSPETVTGDVNAAIVSGASTTVGDPPPLGSPILMTGGPQTIAYKDTTLTLGGASATVAYAGQTLTMGGNVVTISSLNEVLSYGSAGIVAQLPGGGVSTIPIQAEILESTPGASTISPTAGGGPAATIASLIYWIMNGGPSPSTTGSFSTYATATAPTTDSGNELPTGSATNSASTETTGSVAPLSSVVGFAGSTQLGNHTIVATGTLTGIGGSASVQSSNSGKINPSSCWGLAALSFGVSIFAAGLAKPGV